MPNNNYVLTNCLAETEKDRELYNQVKVMAKERGSFFVPVQLQILNDEHLKRITRQERLARSKSINPKEAENNEPLLSISHPNFLELEISKLSAEDTASSIIKHINKARRL